MELLSSAQNPKIKYLQELYAKSRTRSESGLFVVEGRRELEHCMEAGLAVESVFVCSEIYGSDDALIEALQASGATVFGVSAQVYSKIAYRDGTEGIIAEVKARYIGLNDLDLSKPRIVGNNSKNCGPLVVVLESVEKPGNLGAVLRSADAAGADAVIVCDRLTDLYNPNLIRASIGAIFTVPTVACTSDEAISWLTEHGFSILTAQLQDSELYYDADMTGATAIVFGTESTGLTDKWRKAASAHIRIPMLGRLDSLNISVSAAILLFEATRQRLSCK